MPIRLAMLLVLAIASNLQAVTVVVNDNLEWSAIEEDFNGSNHFARLEQTPSGDPTSTWFRYDDGAIVITSINLDESSDWYVFDEGQIFSEATAKSNEARRLNDVHLGGVTVPIEIGTSSDIYLGMRTSVLYDPGPTESTRTVYGWVRLRPVALLWFGELELEYIESAIAYDSRGIIVGTTTVVPEPSSFLLLLASSLFLSPCRHR